MQATGTRSNLLVMLVAAGALLPGCSSSPAAQEPTPAPIAEPVRDPAVPSDTGTAVSKPPPEVPLPALRLARATSRDERLTLKVEYAAVRLGEQTGYVRTYNGQLIGPTIRARPGDTLFVELVNGLPDDPSDPAGHGQGGHSHAGHAAADHDINTPHGFNVTNLHVHGLHVRPDYPSRCQGKPTCDAVADNVLIDVAPGATQRYEIEIPKNHPPGTHWYHAHKHGSVALQLASGMAGMLIIEGGLDDLPALANVREQLLVFQQLRLTDCGRNVVAKGQGPDKCTLTAGDQVTYYESCSSYFQGLVNAGVMQAPPAAATACVENFDFVFGARRPQVLAPEFGYHTAINGQIIPVIEMRQGELQRWRTLHAGILEGLQLGLVAQADAASQMTGDALTTAADKRTPMYAIAYDGIATGRMDSVDHMELQPGYRADLLVRVDQPGDYLLIDIPTSAQSGLQGTAEDYYVLAKVRVLPSSEPAMPLPDASALAPLAPYKHVEDKEIKGCQYATFNFGSATAPDGTTKTTFLINGSPYDPAAAPRTMTLGSADEWVLSSKSVNHPFHIHVNPFELQEDYGVFKKGTWKDTLLVMQDKPVRVRSRYEDFTGKFVLHCHILNHEDQGMMEEVEVLPRGKKNTSCPPLAKSGSSMCAVPPPEDGTCTKRK